jgi:oligosaccharide repeat unit polymerase
MLVLTLYLMQLSELLIFSPTQVARLVAWIVVPYVVTVVYFQAFCFFSPKKLAMQDRHNVHGMPHLGLVEARVYRWFSIWCAMTVIEIIFSGGLPIAQKLGDGSSHYVDFGLPVVHVFLSSLLMVLALFEFGIYILLGGRRHLAIPAWLVLWSFLELSRAVMIIAILQWCVLWILLKGVSKKLAFKVVGLAIITLLIFGYTGDQRTGSSSFLYLAKPSSNYPGWLPSGVLWSYIYSTTPMNNLVNTSIQTKPLDNVAFPNTLYYVFPTVIRAAIYGKEAVFATGGDLVADNFTVSTAYLSPYVDYGIPGIVIFSSLLGIIGTYCWRKRRTFRGRLLYAIVAQCLVFSVFYDFLLMNAFLGQVFWIYFLFRTARAGAGAKRTNLAMQLGYTK